MTEDNHTEDNLHSGEIRACSILQRKYGRIFCARCPDAAVAPCPNMEQECETCKHIDNCPCMIEYSQSREEAFAQWSEVTWTIGERRPSIGKKVDPASA